MPALQGSGDQVERGGDGFRRVAERGEPVDVWLAAEPGELTLGEAAGGLLDICDGCGESDGAFEVGAEVGVADELEWLGIDRNSGRNECADFVEPAGGEHFVHAGVDAGVEGGTRRREADFGDGVAFEGVVASIVASIVAYFAMLVTRRVDVTGAASAENLGDWLTCEDAHLDGADYFLGVAGGDAGGGRGVETGEDFVQVRCAMLLGAAA